AGQAVSPAISMQAVWVNVGGGLGTHLSPPPHPPPTVTPAQATACCDHTACCLLGLPPLAPQEPPLTGTGATITPSTELSRLLGDSQLVSVGVNAGIFTSWQSSLSYPTIDGMPQVAPEGEEQLHCEQVA